jgi:Ca-activated chloride channel family protein
MTFKYPLFFILLPVVLVFVALVRRRGRRAAFSFSSLDILPRETGSLRLLLARNLIFSRALSLVLIVIALARPQSPFEASRVDAEGIDIVLALDCSTSMLAEDFASGNRRQNRLDAAKEVVREFIKARRHDRIGIVAFAGRPYIASPLTLDYGWLFQNLERVKAGMIEDGTAIGSGILTSLNRLKDTQAKSKVVILLTDGRNNAGSIDPSTAAEAAKALGIKIYTVGAGSRGPVPYPVRDIFGARVYQQIEIDIDEDSLKNVAAITGGRYFRATDTESLRAVYREIDRMERTTVMDTGYRRYRELFGWFALPALALVLFEMAAGQTCLRSLP